MQTDKRRTVARSILWLLRHFPHKGNRYGNILVKEDKACAYLSGTQALKGSPVLTTALESQRFRCGISQLSHGSAKLWLSPTGTSSRYRWRHRATHQSQIKERQRSRGNLWAQVLEKTMVDLDCRVSWPLCHSLSVSYPCSHSLALISGDFHVTKIVIVASRLSLSSELVILEKQTNKRPNKNLNGFQCPNIWQEVTWGRKGLFCSESEGTQLTMPCEEGMQ